jgi:hypothetical protein
MWCSAETGLLTSLGQYAASPCSLRGAAGGGLWRSGNAFRLVRRPRAVSRKHAPGTPWQLPGLYYEGRVRGTRFPIGRTPGGRQKTPPDKARKTIKATTKPSTPTQATNPFINEEEFKRDLMHRILDIAEFWRRCELGKCPRLRRSAGPPFSCVEKAEPMTPEETARMQVELRDALDQRLAELRGGRKPEQWRRSLRRLAVSRLRHAAKLPARPK